MVVFEVNDMGCGGCAAAIKGRLQALDKAATFEIDLARHRVKIRGSAMDPARLGAAIAGAGYTPVVVSSASVASSKAHAGCCCS